MHQVPAIPAEALKAARGVDAYWVAWPGVDVSASAPTLLFLHGGGMCSGSALSSRGFLDRLSHTFAMRVLSLEYPLCPEATPSEAVASALAAYMHLLDDLQVPPKKVLLDGRRVSRRYVGAADGTGHRGSGHARPRRCLADFRLVWEQGRGTPGPA